MPAALPLAAYAVAVGAEWGALATFVAVSAASVAAGFIQQSLAEKRLRSLVEEAAGVKVNSRSVTDPMRVVYGQAMVGGTDVFMEPTGTDNKDLWIVQTLAEGECHGILQVDGVDQVFLDDKLPSEYGGNVSYFFHSGTGSQTVDPNLHAALPKWTDPLRHTCYIIWKLHFDRDYFNSLPRRTVILKGRKVYDFRSGSLAWSDNPVLCMYDYFTNSQYGAGYDRSVIDIDSWTAAANYCDAKNFTCNVVLTGTETMQEVLDLFCALFRGQLVWYDGKFFLRYSDLNYETVGMVLGDDHIARDPDGRASLSIGQPSMFRKPDGLRAKFVNPDKQYTMDDLLVGDTAGVIRDFPLFGATRRSHVREIAIYRLEREQLDRTLSGLFRDDCLALEPHDLVQFSSSAFGISNQIMRVTEASWHPSGLVGLSLLWEDVDLYNQTYDDVTETAYTCSLPDKDAPLPGVGNVTVTEQQYSYRLRSFTRLLVSFAKPDDWRYSHVEVWFSTDNVEWRHLFDTTSDFQLDPVQEGQTIWLRLKVVSIFGTKSADADDYKISYRVKGQNAAPPSVADLSAVVSGSTVNLYAARLTDPDVELYEFRLGPAWSTGLMLGANRSPTLSLTGVKPGSHTIWINPVSNNGEYGTSPASTVIHVQEPPPGLSIVQTIVDDLSANATWSNASLTSGWIVVDSQSLSGLYRSPVFDLGSSGQRTVYLLADIIGTGAGSTWADNISGTETWNDINADTTEWRHFYGQQAAAQVNIRLYYGDTTTPYNENKVERLEILTASFAGRYIQFEVEIVKPNYQISAQVGPLTIKICQ